MVPLHCGHKAYREVIVLYDVFAPSKVDVWCERCGDWSTILKRPARDLPADPLF